MTKKKKHWILVKDLISSNFFKSKSEKARLIKQSSKVTFKDGAYYCYCAYVLRISRYSDFLSPMPTEHFRTLLTSVSTPKEPT